MISDVAFFGEKKRRADKVLINKSGWSRTSRRYHLWVRFSTELLDKGAALESRRLKLQAAATASTSYGPTIQVLSLDSSFFRQVRVGGWPSHHSSHGQSPKLKAWKLKETCVETQLLARCKLQLATTTPTHEGWSLGLNFALFTCPKLPNYVSGLYREFSVCVTVSPSTFNFQVLYISMFMISAFIFYNFYRS